MIDAYGVRDDFPDPDLYGLSKRAVFVVDGERTVTYARATDDASREPASDEVIAAADDAE
jgi:peroxiredoxin